jgi:hypothetical protein
LATDYVNTVKKVNTVPWVHCVHYVKEALK